MKILRACQHLFSLFHFPQKLWKNCAQGHHSPSKVTMNSASYSILHRRAASTEKLYQLRVPGRAVNARGYAA